MVCCRVRISTSCRQARALTWSMTNATRWTFVLWKMSKEGEPSWPSPWGAGRPGSAH
ncbi:hypothetical protein ACLK1T_04345 [Escherichia coli]